MITKHVRAYAVRNTGKIYLISNTAIHRVQYEVHTSVQVMPVTLCMIKQSPQGTCIFAEYTCKTMKYCSISRASFHIKKKITQTAVSLSLTGGAALVDVICQIEVELSYRYAHVVRIDT